MVKNKLKNLVVPEQKYRLNQGSERWRLEITRSWLKTKKPLLMNLGVEKTSDEIDDLVGEKVKLEDEDSVINAPLC